MHRLRAATLNVFGLFGLEGGEEAAAPASASPLPADARQPRTMLASGEVRAALNGPVPWRHPDEDAEWTPNPPSGAPESAADESLRMSLIRNALGQGVSINAAAGPSAAHAFPSTSDAASVDEMLRRTEALRLANLRSSDYPQVQFVHAKSTLYSPSHMRLTVNQSLCVAFLLVLLLLCAKLLSPRRLDGPYCDCALLPRHHPRVGGLLAILLAALRVEAESRGRLAWWRPSAGTIALSLYVATLSSRLYDWERVVHVMNQTTNIRFSNMHHQLGGLQVEVVRLQEDVSALVANVSALQSIVAALTANASGLLDPGDEARPPPLPEHSAPLPGPSAGETEVVGGPISLHVADALADHEARLRCLEGNGTSPALRNTRAVIRRATPADAIFGTS